MKMANRLDPELLADLIRPRDVRISPDGKQVLYSCSSPFVRNEEHVRASLWLADMGREGSARQITQGNFFDTAAMWSPDGKYISFTSDRVKAGYNSVLYLLPLSGGEAFPITSKENEMGIGAYRWRPDSKAIAFVSADEKTEETKQKEKDKKDVKIYDEDIDYGKIRIVDIVTKEVKNLVSIEHHVTSFDWNLSGTEIAYAAARTPELNDLMSFGSRIHIVNLEKDDSKFLHDLGTEALELCWSEDKLYFYGNYDKTTWATSKALYEMSATSDEHEYKIVAHGEVNDVSHAMKCSTGEVLVCVEHGLSRYIETLDGKELLREKRQLTSWDAHLSSSQESIAIAQGSVGKPVEVFSIINGDKVQLSKHGGLVAEKDLGKAHLCEYTHEDGTPIDGFYAVPTALATAFAEGKPQATVLVVRGGPQSHMTDNFDVGWNWVPFFMSLGYLVLCPNYRGGTSHGHSYANAVAGDASQSYQDVIWLVKKGIEERRIDADRVAITGWSQGGYLSYLAVTRDDTFHFRAAVPGAGVSDWGTMPLTTDLPHYESDISGPTPWNLDDITNIQTRECSPIYHMQNINTPVLILHGQIDARTPLEQAVGFYRAMKAKGKDVTLAVYPREGHCGPVPWERAHYIDKLERLEKFLERHMRS